MVDLVLLPPMAIMIAEFPFNQIPGTMSIKTGVGNSSEEEEKETEYF